MRRCAEGTLGNVEKQWNSLKKQIFVMHRYAEGTLGNVEKPMEFRIKIYLSHASLRRGIPRKC